jgi:hypothetical protein
MAGVSLVVGSAPSRLLVPKHGKLIVIAAAIADVDKIPDEVIIETHVLYQKGRRERIRGHKAKKLLVINGGYDIHKPPPEQFDTLLTYDEREDILSWHRDDTIERYLGHWSSCTCGVFAICKELLTGNKVIANRISFAKRRDAEALEVLRTEEDFTWLT